MALLTYNLILLFLKYTLAKNCVIDNTPEYVTWEKKLLDDLKCDYNPHYAPKGNTVVNITYFMEFFAIHDDLQVMTLQTWMFTSWIDERLKWDPDKYHGINESDVSNFHIWTPIFGLSNYEDFLEYYLSFYRYALKSTGKVHCKHRMLQETKCSLKLTTWPYDVQECSFEFDVTKSSRKTGNYTVNFDFLVMEPNSSEWYIYDYNQVQDNSTNGQLKLTFFLMREAVGLSAIVIWPAFIQTVLSVLSLCLDVRRTLRLAIICFSLLGHYYFLTELSYDIPKESHFPPTLLLYYRGSVILSVIIVFSTFFLDSMCKSKSTPHHYVTQINDFVYENTYRTYFVFPRWDFDDPIVDSKSSSEDWLKFANIVNSVLIFIIILAYTGLYGTCIPQRILILSK